MIDARKFILTTFFVTAGVYGSLMIITDYALRGELNLASNLIQCTVFGIIMTVIFYYSQKRNFKMQNGKIVSVHQKSRIVSDLDLETLIDKMQNKAPFSKMKYKQIPGGYELSTVWSLKSWGEVIRILYISEESDGFHYDVTSSPKLMTTLVDFGMNFENIQGIKHLAGNPSN